MVIFLILTQLLFSATNILLKRETIFPAWQLYYFLASAGFVVKGVSKFKKDKKKLAIFQYYKIY